MNRKMLLTKSLGDGCTHELLVYHDTKWAICTQKVEGHNDVILWEDYVTEAEVLAWAKEGWTTGRLI